MKYTDNQGIERDISLVEMNEVYAALGTLAGYLSQEHIAEYFKRPMHDEEVYATFKNGVDRVRGLLAHVAEVPA